MLRLDHAAHEQAPFHRGVTKHRIFDRAKGDDLFPIPGDHRRCGHLRAVADHQVDFAIFLIGPKAAILTLQVLREQIDHRCLESLGHFFGQVRPHVPLWPAELCRRCRRTQRMKVGCSLENAVMQQVGMKRDVLGIMAYGRCLGVVRVGLGIENHATTPGFVQNKLHALAGSKLGNAMQIGDHSGVPASNGSFEMRRQSCPNGWGLSLE